MATATRFLCSFFYRRRPLPPPPLLPLLLHLSRPNPTSPSPLPFPPPPPTRWCFFLSPCVMMGPWAPRSFSNGSVNLVLSSGGKPKFETLGEGEPPRRERYRTKKRLKLQRKREKKSRKDANRRDPRCIRVKGKKQKFPNAESRIKYKIDKAKIKEALLVERLKKYEVLKLQGPVVKPENLTGEERFYMKKMAQKRSNYVPIGRRGVFGGVILNMHLHWKKHETVKVVCKPCKPGQVHEYAREIARLSGGIPIQVIGNDTIIFYRGKDYIQPEVMSPIDTLSKKRALEKSKYEQSLETVRRFIAISEKELELYYRHVALYGDPSRRNLESNLVDQITSFSEQETGTSESKDEESIQSLSDLSVDVPAVKVDFDGELLQEVETDSYMEQQSHLEGDLDDDESRFRCTWTV